MNQVKILSSIDSYRIFVCHILESLSDRNFYDFGQNEYRIFQLTSQIISSLMNSNNNVIKQNILEVIVTFQESGKQDIIKDLMKISVSVQQEVVDYFNREVTDSIISKEYYSALNNNKFEHECVRWQTICSNKNSKRRKSEDVSTPFSHKTKHLVSEQNKLSVYTPHFSRSKSMPDNTENSQSECDTVSEAIMTLKGEVKCLTKILKTDKLSAKNVSELKIIANQLLSWI